MMTRRMLFGIVTLAAVWGATIRSPAKGAEPGVLRAGAHAIDITPPTLPVIVNGGFLEKRADKIHSRLHARCLVLDDGRTRMAIVVVDNCLMPRTLLDEAKRLASETTGLRPDRILISATHTHSAPSVVGALGSSVDEGYARFLPGRIARGLERAVAQLAPATAGWAVVRDFEHTHCRRWIRRSDRVGNDPFGLPTIRAMMHPGYQNPDYVGPAGPVDPGLSLLALRGRDGRPIALLANYSMHYFGAAAISADYYGLFAEKFARLIGAENLDPPFVAFMSQGTSGDLHWMDYRRPKRSVSIEQYADDVARLAHDAWAKIEYHERVPLAMVEKKLALRCRAPDDKRLAWARDVLSKMKGDTPSSQVEVYAREQVLLDQDPVRELKLQALRIGGLGIAAMPCEVYGITGLKIKAQSPLQPTINFELANGAAGYIPPPEQHALGGYTTWPARSACLEVEAEPKIVEAVLGLLEEVAGEPRREVTVTHGPYPRGVLASEPRAYWRMEGFSGRRAEDASVAGDHGVYEDGVAFYLEGPASVGFGDGARINRAAHFAGGRLRAAVAGLGRSYSVGMWFFNGLPNDARLVTGYLFSRGVDGDADARGDHLGIGGTHSATGKLVFYNGDVLEEALTGTTKIEPKTWHHVVLTREDERVTVYLDGRREIAGEAAIGFAGDEPQIFIGGRNDNFANFEGKIDEVAVHDRPLSAREVARQYEASGVEN